MKRKDILKRDKKISLALQKKKKIKTFEEILFSQAFSIIGGLTAGSLLAVFLNKIMLIPGLFILLPGFLEMGNAISGSLAARLSSKLHLKGLTKLLILKNIVASFLLTILSSITLGAIVYIISRVLFGINNKELFFIPVLAAFISGIIILPLISKIVTWLYHHHDEPDNIMGPILTTIGDIVNTGSILLAIIIIA